MKTLTDCALRSALPRLTRLCILACSALLAACATEPDKNPCAPSGKNYLGDADFALEEHDSRSKYWGALQHAGERSFSYSVKEGVLSIKKIGEQPWFLFRQRLRTTELSGQTVIFTAQARWSTTLPDYQPLSSDSGLALTALAASGKILLQSAQAHTPLELNADWQTLLVVVEIPTGTRTIEAAFMHQAEGTLQVRNPQLTITKGNAQQCMTQ